MPVHALKVPVFWQGAGRKSQVGSQASPQRKPGLGKRDWVCTAQPPPPGSRNGGENSSLIFIFIFLKWKKRKEKAGYVCTCSWPAAGGAVAWRIMSLILDVNCTLGCMKDVKKRMACFESKKSATKTGWANWMEIGSRRIWDVCVVQVKREIRGLVPWWNQRFGEKMTARSSQIWWKGVGYTIRIENFRQERILVRRASNQNSRIFLIIPLLVAYLRVTMLVVGRCTASSSRCNHSHSAACSFPPFFPSQESKIDWAIFWLPLFIDDAGKV